METTDTPKPPPSLDEIRNATFFFGSYAPYMLRLFAIFVINYLNIYIDSWAVLVTSQTHLVYIITNVVFLVYFFWNTAGFHISFLFWLSILSSILGITNLTALNVQYFSSELDPKLIPSDSSMSATVFGLRLGYCAFSTLWDLLAAKKLFTAVSVQSELLRTLRSKNFPDFLRRKT